MTKLTFFILFQTLIFNYLFGQDISIEIDKEKYKFDEKITVIFKSDFKEDSIKLPEFEGLKIISGPNTGSSMSTINGVTEHTKTWTYFFRPIKSGKIVIESPTLFLDGQAIKCSKKTIKVLKSNLSEEEVKEYMFKSFVEDGIKPKGTYRYILNDKIGYIEIYGDLSWKYHRRLTDEEFKAIKKIE